MDRLTANSTVPLRKTKSVDEVLITGSHQTADTEFELNHYIQGDRTVGLSANTEFDLNRSIHGHSTTVDLSANTEFGLNHSIHGHSRTVDLSANTEFDLNRSIHGHSTTVDLSANTEFGLNHSIHGHSTDEFPFSPSSAHYRTMFENQQNYEVPLSQSNLHHLTNPYLKDFPGPNDPGLKTWLQWSPSSVGYTNVEVDSDSDSPNISKIKPTNFEAEALGLSLQKIKNDELEQIRELGSGTYGVVYHGKWKGSDVVIKRIKLSLFAESPSKREHLIADFLKEPSILASLSHPNVIAFYGIVHDGPDGSLATVTEFMVNGSLKQVLKKKDRTINLHKKLIIAMDAAFGMEYLHWKNIVHFDLKCENLLVNMGDPHRPVCKIGGVGLSRMKRKTLVSGDVRGSLPWMVAPELLNPNSQMVTERIDVYSFGIVMWEMLTGEEPYANMHFTSIIGDIVKNSLRPQVPSWCDPEWKSLMENCWASDPSERPSFSEISQKLRKMYAAIKLK